MSYIEYGVRVTVANGRSIVHWAATRDYAEARAAHRARDGETADVVWREIGDWKPLGKDAAR